MSKRYKSAPYTEWEDDSPLTIGMLKFHCQEINQSRNQQNISKQKVKTSKNKNEDISNKTKDME
jgi:hypothetical protein